MIKFDKFTLSNGLKVIIHNDPSTSIVAFNLLYNVGSRNENPERTGFAHLFEHLMFEGSINIPSYDNPLQIAAGENNAYTTNDITNYYITIPKENIETAFWLESDRMLGLDLSEEKLEIQKKVVIEEFNQRYRNQPYGDVYLLLRPLAYKVHPYQWPTIGKDISHIQNASLSEVKNFFNHHYAPNNAILSIAGNISGKDVENLTEKWFGGIPKRDIAKQKIPKEPIQTEQRFMQVERNIPVDGFYKAYHMCSKLDKDYYASDIISDILSNGKSSRLYQNLVKGKKLFSDINAYITGDIDEGLFMISGKLSKGVNPEIADKSIETELQRLINDDINDYEIEKVKNKFESLKEIEQTSILDKASDLAYHELLGDAGRINQEVEKYRSTKIEDIKNVASNIFKPANSSTLYYLSKQQ